MTGRERLPELRQRRRVPEDDVMGLLGQVVILRVPAEKLRETNRVIEQTAWGGYRTEFYPTYDNKPVWDAIPHHRP